MEMLPETGLKISQNVVLFGAIGAAVLTIAVATAQHFASQFQAEISDSLQKNIDARLEEILTNVRPISAKRLEEKTKELLASEPNEAELREKYPLGYGILSIEGDDWFVLPRSSEFVWRTLELVKVEKDSVTVRLPDYGEDDNRTLFGNQATIPRQPGTEFSIDSFGMQMFVKVLSTDARSLKVLVAATGLPPGGMAFERNLFQQLTPEQMVEELFQRADRAVQRSKAINEQQRSY